MPIAETVAAKAPVAAAVAKPVEEVATAAKAKADRERVGTTIKNAGNAGIALAICDAIHEKAAYLSQIDGETGDGDHGINMNKGFLMAKERITDDMTLSQALNTIGDTLVKDIGGSMGPIYGTFFETLADGIDVPEFDATDLKDAFANVVDALKDLAGAKEGDKTLIDTAAPASRAFAEALGAGKTLGDAFEALAQGAANGLESTRGMQAKIGRAARLGERSIGHLDAGATSCDVILETLAKGLGSLLK
jgi:dihydroxyacetone kinase-like protein